MIKYQVHWVHNQLGKDETHGVFDTHEQAVQSIYDWWNQNDYSPSYVRSWTHRGVTTLDYGYHHMFYKIKEIEMEESEQPLTEKPEILYTKDPGAVTPNRGRELDIAHDLYTNADAILLPDRLGATLVPTGIHTAFDPEKYGLFVSPRSSIMKYPIALANSTGLIEGAYRGDVGLPLRTTTRCGFSPQSERILFVNEKGELKSMKVSEFIKDKERYKLYLSELEKLKQDFALLFGKDIAQEWHQAILKKNLAGKRVVPTGTLFLPKGIRLAQAYLVDRKDPVWREVETLPESVRGENGYGSSGAF